MVLTVYLTVVMISTDRLS